MSLLSWLFNMAKRPDPDVEEISKDIYETHLRHEAAQKRLDKLTSVEIARLRSLQLQAEVISRKSKGG